MKMRMVALAIVALLGLGVAACGGDDDSVSQEELEQATEEAAEEAREEAESEAELDELREELRALRKRQNEGQGDDIPEGDTTTTTTIESGSGGVPSDARDCGGGVFARADTTSCAFALNVAATYFSTPNNSQIDVFSPATGQTYRMSCTGGSPVVCTGGDNAAVYILVS